MTLPIVSAGLAGILIILQQLLMLTAGARRAKTGQGVGHGGDLKLERLVRRHGNLAENAAIFIVVLALLEMLGTNGTIVAWMAGIFITARLLHAVAFCTLAGSHGGEHAKDGGGGFVLMRASGAGLTALTGIAAGGYLAMTAWQLMGT